MIRPVRWISAIFLVPFLSCDWASVAAELRTVDSLPAPAAPGVIRINCGSEVPHIDEEGNEWEPDIRYFGTDPNNDGRTVNRGDIEVTYTSIPSIYRTERYFFPPGGRNMFKCELPNGRYRVRLHFAETLGVRKGMRQVIIEMEGRRYGPIDIVREAGGVRMALVKEADVEVEDGELNIVFRQAGHDAALINGIEIIPLQSDEGTGS